jgi:hypothetical protein
MKWHLTVPASGPRPSPGADLAVRTVAVALLLGGAAMLIAGVLSPGIAFPLIAIGLALVVIAQNDKRRGGEAH